MRIETLAVHAGHDVDPATGRETTHVEIVRDAAGNPVPSQWDPILTVPEWEALIAIIGAANVPANGDNTRKYLLTGVLRCGKEGCGALSCGRQRVRASTARSSITSVHRAGWAAAAASRSQRDW